MSVLTSVEDVLSDAAFHRRMGCPKSDDASALKEALAEALASNERLQARIDELEEDERALEDAEDALRCGLSKEQRVAGDLCEAPGDDCAACLEAKASREHAAELTTLREAFDAEKAGLVDEVAKLRAELAFVRDERDKFSVEAQRGVAAAKPIARVGRKSKPLSVGQTSLFDALAPHAATEPEPKAQTRAPRSKKKRLWLDAKTPTAPAKRRARRAKP